MISKIYRIYSDESALEKNKVEEGLENAVCGEL